MKVTENIFPIEWRLSDDLVVPYHGKKVFGTFVCGGGSSMGYKLAGYNHIGGVEFLDKYADTYEENLHPKYMFRDDIRNFVEQDLPEELYHLDLLDGSPPCAAFSTSGRREKVWGKQSKYEDVHQQKDDLPFVYCKLIRRLEPKVFLLENVSGLAKGNAKAYLKSIVDTLNDKYRVQVFLLNASSMGCPQIRPRCFVIGINRKYEKLPKLSLDFDCKAVPFNVTKKYWNHPSNPDFSIEGHAIGRYWDDVKVGGKHEKRFNLGKPDPNKPCPTLTASDSNLGLMGLCHPYQKRKLNNEECRLLCTFPLDYKFVSGTEPKNVMGRSVLPVMMANISHQIYEQWLKYI